VQFSLAPPRAAAGALEGNILAAAEDGVGPRDLPEFGPQCEGGIHPDGEAAVGIADGEAFPGSVRISPG
jgi:hypothetical protein